MLCQFLVARYVHVVHDDLLCLCTDDFVLQWLYLGGNLNHATKALQSAPVSHGLFVSSIVGLEGAFFLYYTSWNLFQLLPVAAALGLVAFLSGSRALSEVQERRLAGLR